MFCPSCGKELPNDSQFCTACGASLGTVSTKHRSWKKPLIITVLVLALLAFAGVLLPRLLARRSPGTPALIPYRTGDTWGFCNRKKELVIPTLYDHAYDFADGLAPVELNDKWGYINTTGTLVVPAVYDNAWLFVDGLARVQLNGKEGYIDTTGTQYWED